MVNIQLPPLRNRMNDIQLLADRFLEQCGKRLNRHLIFSLEVYDAFYQHHWPGNVRELMNAVEYAANMSETDVILPEHLPKVFQGKVGVPVGRTLEQILHDVERSIIMNMLHNQGTSVTAKKRITQELGLSLSTLYAKIKSHGVE